MNRQEAGDAPVFPVLSLRHVRAADRDEAEEVTREEIWAARKVDTGEVGHTAGGFQLGALAVEGTVTRALQDAAILLLDAANVDGDDGTGGVATEEKVDQAIQMARVSLETMQATRG